MITLSIKHYSVIALFLFLSLSTSVFACEGQELQRALRIIHVTLDVGYQAGRTRNFQRAYTEGMRLSREVQQLSPSCQAFIEQIGKKLQNDYNPNQVNCYGGVCCDGAGCVGN